MRLRLLGRPRQELPADVRLALGTRRRVDLFVALAAAVLVSLVVFNVLILRKVNAAVVNAATGATSAAVAAHTSETIAADTHRLAEDTNNLLVIQKGELAQAHLQRDALQSQVDSLNEQLAALYQQNQRDAGQRTSLAAEIALADRRISLLVSQLAVLNDQLQRAGISPTIILPGTPAATVPAGSMTPTVTVPCPSGLVVLGICLPKL